MAARVHSVNVGEARTGILKSRRTGIDKRPVNEIHVADPGPRGMGASGVVGDAVVNTKHHGGTTQAVYAVAREELDWWSMDTGKELHPGAFGENVTTAGFDVDAAVIGEQWRIGAAVLSVTAPRVPCATFAARMQVPGWVKAFTARARTGAYLAVLQPGSIHPGDTIEVIWRPGHGITLPMTFRAWMGDRELARQVMDSGALPRLEHEELAAKLAKWERAESRTL